MGDTLQVDAKGCPLWTLLGRRGCWRPGRVGDSRGPPTPALSTHPVGPGPAEEVVAGAGQPGTERLRPQQRAGAPGAGAQGGGRQPGGRPPSLPTPNSPTRKGWQRDHSAVPSPCPPAPGEPPQPAAQLLASRGDGLAEGQGLLQDVSGSLEPLPQTCEGSFFWGGAGSKPCSPLAGSLSVCPQHGAVSRGADGAAAPADEHRRSPGRLSRGVAAGFLQALPHQDIPGGEGPPHSHPVPPPHPGGPTHPLLLPPPSLQMGPND